MGPNWQRQQEQMRRQQEQMRKQQEQVRKQQQEQLRRQQEQMRKQQEQLRKQQEQLRHQQEMGAWYEQQRQKQQQEAKAWAPQPKEGDRFAEVEREVAGLRRDLAAGRLTKEQFKARLHELMVQDAQGGWWMMGVESDRWYRHDETGWVQATPPGRVASGPIVTPTFSALPRSAAEASLRSASPATTSRRWGCAAVLLLLGAVLTLIVGNFVGELAVGVTGGPFYPAYYCAVPIWLGGGIVTFIAALKVWRGR